MTTLARALSVALEHWGGRPGASTLGTAASRCVGFLGPSTPIATLGSSDGVALLAFLRQDLAPKSVCVYYRTLRQVLGLSGVSTEGWPKPPKPPRRTRDALKPDDLERLLTWLDGMGWRDTADLGRIMRGTGLRVNVEALTAAHLRLEEGADFDILHVVGKGAHERLIPVVRSDTRAILRDPVRLEAIRSWAYRTHLDRWKKGVAALAITSRLATPHAVRHGYATEALQKSGGNLVMVQELLGHANVATTSGYVTVDLADKARALSKGA